MPRTPPYQRDHERSISTRMDQGKEPRSFGALLNWYAHAWQDEVPDRLHQREVWRDYGEQGQGGSALGTPRYSDPFRRYLENTPRERDSDGYWVRPCHRALARLAEGAPRHNGKPLTARWLFALALAGFDVQRVADARKMPMEEASVIVEAGLRMLWRLYSEQPGAR